MPRARSQRASQKPSRPASKATAMRLIRYPAFVATSRHRCSNFSNSLSSTANLSASTGLHTEREFANLIVEQTGGAIVRLKDVADVSLGADSYETQVAFEGKPAVYIGIQVAPTANLLDVIAGVHKIFPAIHAALPNGLNGQIVYDSTHFVHAAIRDVVRTLVEALLIVNIVVFLFLGSLRSVVIPMVAIPLSLVGAFTMMLAL